MELDTHTHRVVGLLSPSWIQARASPPVVVAVIVFIADRVA